MKLEVCVGMIASGKSTYVRRRAKEGALVVCHDDLTEMLHAEYRYEQVLRETYRRMEESIVWAILNSGRDAIIDRTHLTRESRQRWIKWASNYGALQTFDGRNSITEIIAVKFHNEGPFIHANRRFGTDPRGRSWSEWIGVAEHHYAQSLKEPLSEDEGFTRIIEINPADLTS